MAEKIRILYAEDSALDADLTRVHFEQEAPDFVLDLVDNGAGCLSQMTKQSYNALLLDNHLPDTDGLDLLAELRAAGHLLPVVMVTGVGDDETVARALREQHVLYIESNDMDAELTQQHFASHAPRLILHMLNNCADALAWLSGPHDIDLVLTDLHMPGMDALEFVHEAKRCQIDLPFVVLTGKGDEATAVALLRLGASDYLVKRDNYLMQLPHAIEHALHRFRPDCTTRRLHSELRSLNASLEAKVAERTAELQATQQRLRATFDAVPNLIWQKDLQGRYQACNAAMERLLVRRQDQLLGQVDADLYDDTLASILQAHDQRVLDSGRPAWQELILPCATKHRWRC